LLATDLNLAGGPGEGSLFVLDLAGF